MDYVFLPDPAGELIYCSRCGDELFADFGRRESHDVWIRKLVEHLYCKETEV